MHITPPVTAEGCSMMAPITQDVLNADVTVRTGGDVRNTPRQVDHDNPVRSTGLHETLRELCFFFRFDFLQENIPREIIRMIRKDQLKRGWY